MDFQSRMENNTTVDFKLPWDQNTFLGWTIGSIIVLILVLIAPFFEMQDAHKRTIQINSVPLMLLNFGEGDGTGMSAGNLAREGRAHQGDATNNLLEDAQVAGLTRQANKENTATLDESSNIIAVNELSSTDRNRRDTLRGTDRRNVGSPTGDPTGTGLGNTGSGPGKGSGFGDIEWGGGGNRTVLSKILPKFPDGVNTSAEIKIRFTVLPDGTVGQIVPLQKADPRLEQAAIEALRRWRFNVLNEDVIMVGTIPLTFQLR